MQSAMGRTRVPQRARLHSKTVTTRSISSGSSEDEESGGDQEGRGSVKEVTWLGQWAAF